MRGEETGRRIAALHQALIGLGSVLVDRYPAAVHCSSTPQSPTVPPCRSRPLFLHATAHRLAVMDHTQAHRIVRILVLGAKRGTTGDSWPAWSTGRMRPAGL